MKVLIIGLGSIAKKHIAALKKIGGTIEIFALRSSKNSSVYEDVKNIFELEELTYIKLDFVIISSPTSKHYENIKELISLNTPLFIEKPLFHNLDVENLISEVKNSKIKTYVACNLRFLESLNFIKNKIKNENLKINEVTAYCGSFLPYWRANKNYKEIYSAIPELGGGVHLDLIHEIDYIYWLFGKPINVHSILTSKSTLGIKSIDYAHYNLEYSNFNTSITLNYFRRKPSRFLELVCEKGTYKVDLINNNVSFEDEILFESNQKALDTYYNQLKYFIKNISNPTFNDIEEAFEVLKICLQK